jgi:hypothetical protein
VAGFVGHLADHSWAARSSSQTGLCAGPRREAGEPATPERFACPPACQPKWYRRTPVGWRHAFRWNLEPFVRAVFPAGAVPGETTDEDLVVARGVDPVPGWPAVAFRTTKCAVALPQSSDRTHIRSHELSVLGIRIRRIGRGLPSSGTPDDKCHDEQRSPRRPF